MIGQAFEASATVESPLGAVSLHISGRSPVKVEVIQAEVPKLPEGMAADGVKLIRVRIATAVTPEHPLRIRATAGGDADAETGEWLDSMSFRTDEGVLQVAMRDRDWLAANGVVAKDVAYEAQSMDQTILDAPAGTTLCVSVAWRIHDSAVAAKDDISTWFAADLALPG